MPILLINGKAHRMGKVASPLSGRLLSLLVPIVPKTYLFNVVVISNKEVMGMCKCVYTRKSLNHLGMNMGTRRFLCAKK